MNSWTSPRDLAGGMRPGQMREVLAESQRSARQYVSHHNRDRQLPLCGQDSPGFESRDRNKPHDGAAHFIAIELEALFESMASEHRDNRILGLVRGRGQNALSRLD